jgi:hypothetical protein
VTREAFASWISRYEQLWRTAGTDRLGQLFADDATYLHSPYDTPVRGLAAIAADWERERDGADEEFTMSSEILAVDGDTGVARVRVEYGGPKREYLDLWVVRFDGTGRCVSFEEWPFWPDRPWSAGTP